MVNVKSKRCKQKDCEKHVEMLKGEIKLHKVQKKWDG